MARKSDSKRDEKTAGPDAQMDLFSKSKLERSFERWIERNPQVWDWFVYYAFQAMKAMEKKSRKTGRPVRCSPDFIAHRIRWFAEIESDELEEFKINNNHVAYLSRRFAREFPEHRNFFEQRVVSSTPGTNRMRGQPARRRRMSKSLGD